MSLIESDKLCYEAEHCRETTDAFIELIKQQPKAVVHINLNETVKFKLNDHGKDIFYHQYDEINKRLLELGGKQLPIEPTMPKVDADGYTEMQLWTFMQIFGPHTGMGFKNYIQPLEIIYEERY